jgi:hypothetical protein
MERVRIGVNPQEAGGAAPSGIVRMRASREIWACRLRAWLLAATYRPERHYMRGSK